MASREMMCYDPAKMQTLEHVLKTVDQTLVVLTKYFGTCPDRWFSVGFVHTALLTI